METCFCDVHVLTSAPRSSHERQPPAIQHSASFLYNPRFAPTQRHRRCCSSCTVSSNYAAETLAACHEARTSGRPRGFTIRPVQAAELHQVAWLRAEAYYEDQGHVRYVGSFKRQFKEQEARSLKERTRVRPGAALPDCVCLVCLLPSAGSSSSSSSGSSNEGTVVGTLDAEPPGTRQRSEVPQGAMYVLNVVVDKNHRRRGVGQALVHAAARMAVQQWGSAAMCAHVSAQNDAALALYRMCGFAEVQEIVSQTSSVGSKLGKQYFLMAEL